MKSAAKQWLTGLLPFAVGLACNYLFLLLPIPMFFFNIAYLAFWGWLCGYASDAETPLLPQILRICLPGAVTLILALYQELILGSYVSGPVGLLTQFYFLPGMSLFGLFLIPFMEIIRPWPFYIAEYVCMAALCLAACLLRRSKEKSLP